MVVLMLVEVVAAFKTMRQFSCYEKTGECPEFFQTSTVPYPSEVYFTTQYFSLLIYLMTVHTG